MTKVTSLTFSTVSFIVFLLLCYGSAAIGGWITSQSIGGWYLEITKPALNPPNIVFPIVWNILYGLMAVSGWLVYTRVEDLKAKRLLLGLFGLQLVLNIVWSFLFFGIQRIDLAFADIVLTWLALIPTIVLFWKHQRLAGALWVPYGLWLSFAMYLNGAIWQLN